MKIYLTQTREWLQSGELEYECHGAYANKDEAVSGLIEDIRTWCPTVFNSAGSAYFNMDNDEFIAAANEELRTQDFTNELGDFGFYFSYVNKDSHPWTFDVHSLDLN